MANRKVPLYIPSRRAHVGAVRPESQTPAQPSKSTGSVASGAVGSAGATAPPARTQRLQALGWAGVGAALALAAALALISLQPSPRVITQARIDAAVRHSLEKDPLPSRAMKAYDNVGRSVVRVVGLMDEEDDALERPDKMAMERSLGTGVVIKVS